MTNEEFLALPIAERKTLGALIDWIDRFEKEILQHEKFEALLILAGYREGSVAYYASDYQGMQQAMAAVTLRRKEWKRQDSYDE